jgi:uracil-DNA glycosylase
MNMPSLQELHEKIIACTSCRAILPLEQIVPRSGFPPNGKYSMMLIGPEPNPTARTRRSPEEYRDTFNPAVRGHRNTVRNLFRSFIAAGIGFDEIFYTNAVKCPSEGEESARCFTNCESFLTRQIEAVRPRVLVAFGRGAPRLGLPKAKKGELIRTSYSGIPSLVVTHPQGARKDYLGNAATAALDLLRGVTQEPS